MKTMVQLAAFIQRQPDIARMLRLVDQLGLPDCWIAGGCIRRAVWDFLQGQRTSARCDDVDVVYFANAQREQDRLLEASLYRACPDVSWSVKNQARMHHRNGDTPYLNSWDAVWHWPETSSAIAARLFGESIALMAPHGIDDLVNGVVRPTRAVEARMDVYRRRIRAKNWKLRWPRLTVVQ
jgi:hypothetical protein